MPVSPQDRFIETLGLISQTEGSPRISGQILGCLVLANEPLSLTEIAERLDVSKASVSTNVRLLEIRGMARREAMRGSRQDHWSVVENPHQQVLATLADRFRRNADTVKSIAADFPEQDNGQAARVAGFAEFYLRSADFLDSWAQTLAPQDQPEKEIPSDVG